MFKSIHQKHFCWLPGVVGSDEDGAVVGDVVVLNSLVVDIIGEVVVRSCNKIQTLDSISLCNHKMSFHHFSSWCYWVCIWAIVGTRTTDFIVFTRALKNRNIKACWWYELPKT